MIKLKDDVRCIQFTDNSFDEIVELLGDKYMGFRTNPIVNKGSIMFSNFTVSPAFGEIIEGDYVIKGISGEFYPCKPDIFHKTYEEVK